MKDWEKQSYKKIHDALIYAAEESNKIKGYIMAGNNDAALVGLAEIDGATSAAANILWHTLTITEGQSFTSLNIALDNLNDALEEIESFLPEE